MLSILLKEDKSKEAHGLDLSPNMVQVAKKKLQDKAQIVVGDSEHLPYHNDYFDVVCCNDSFHHYPNPDNVLKEICRVLKDGGHFILGDTWQPFIGRVIMNGFMKFSHEGDVKMYSEDEITKLLKKYFSNVQWKQINNTSYICTAVKKLK